MHLHCATQPVSPFRGNVLWNQRISVSAFISCRSKSCKVLAPICGQSDSPGSGTDLEQSPGSKTVKRKVAMWVGYVGTHYKGLQIQRTSASGQTIEEELERAIFRAGGILESNFGNLEKIRWMRSSRTDKGVHSLSTVISFKMEFEQSTSGNTADGIAVADKINEHLPKSIRIFGIVPVNKSFDPRRGCCSRTYHYLLPARVIGIKDDSLAEKVQQCILKFQGILSSFEGRHPYHNYTVRANYRKKAGPIVEKVVTKNNDTKDEDLTSELEDDSSPCEDEFELKEDVQLGSTSEINMQEVQPEDLTSELEDDGSPCENEFELKEGVQLGSTSGINMKEVQPEASSSHPKIRWLYERDMVDKIYHAHFRKIITFRCTGLEEFDGLRYLKLSVHGESFMLHQIRKMVGTAVAIMRGVLPLDTIPISLSLPCRMALPLAPSEGLFLASNDFFPFRTNLVKPKGVEEINALPRLKMSDIAVKRKEEFWLNVLRPEIILLLKDTNSIWTEWLEKLELGRISEAEMNIVRTAWYDWTSQVTPKHKTAENLAGT